jgi:hypothetical protein
MGSFPRSGLLSGLQQDLLREFAAREQRMFLTGGAALAGFYFGHRTTEDLDFFAAPGLDLGEAARALEEAASAAGASLQAVRTFPTFRRFLARRGGETCVVDLVIDQAPMVVSEKDVREGVRVDPLREIAANKVCALVSRSEIKDLVDLKFLLGSGLSLDQALADAKQKDGAVDPATLAWILEQVAIMPDAALPGGTDAVELEQFRAGLVQVLRKLAFGIVRP